MAGYDVQGIGMGPCTRRGCSRWIEETGRQRRRIGEASGQADRRDGRGGGVGERKEELSRRVGRRADGRVEEASGWQGVATGLMEELDGLGCLGKSGGLACRVRSVPQQRVRVGSTTASVLGLSLTQNNKLIKIIDTRL